MTKMDNQESKTQINKEPWFKTSLWDIFKSAFVIFLVVVLYIKADGWINKFLDSSAPGLTEPQIVRISESVVRIQNIANQQRFKDLEVKLKESNSQALKSAQEYADSTNAHITSLGQVMSQLKTSFEESKPKVVYVDKEVATRSFEHYDLVRKVGGKKLPVGWVKYHPEWEGEDPLVQYFYPLEYYTNIVRTEHENGTFSYTAETYLENNFVKKSKGIQYPLKLKNITFEEMPFKGKKFRFNPRIALGGGFTTESLFPQLNLSVFSYGRTEVDMDWRFLTVGVGQAGDGDDGNKFVGVFTPLEYNIGKLLPIVDNIFVGPSFSVDSDSKTGYGALLSVPF